MASIIVVFGPNEGDYYPLGRRTVVVGRDEKCAIQIVDDQISRKHLQIRHDEAEQSYHALDMKSSNGVSINGRQITVEASLVDGDIIELGNSKLMFFAQDFPDRKSAWDYYKLCGERDKGTMLT